MALAIHANYSKPAAADFVVLDRDYVTVLEDEIRFLRPVLTVVGGRAVYETK